MTSDREVAGKPEAVDETPKDAYTRGFSDGWNRCVASLDTALGRKWPATDLGATDEEALAIHRAAKEQK
jgi:hypothetical protein